MVMNVHLRDYALANSGWQSALGAHFQAVDARGENDLVPRDGEHRIVFLHSHTHATDVALREWSRDNGTRHLVLIGSGGGISESLSDHANRVHACWWKPQDLVSEHVRTEVRSLVSAIKDNARDWWKWLQPTDTSVLIALTILCQGYLAARDRYDLLCTKDQRPHKTSPVPAEAAQTVVRTDWWKHPFTGVELDQEVENECHGDTPDEIKKLLKILGGPENLYAEHDSVVGGAFTRIQALLNQ